MHNIFYNTNSNECNWSFLKLLMCWPMYWSIDLFIDRLIEYYTSCLQMKTNLRGKWSCVCDFCRRGSTHCSICLHSYLNWKFLLLRILTFSFFLDFYSRVYPGVSNRKQWGYSSWPLVHMKAMWQAWRGRSLNEQQNELLAVMLIGHSANIMECIRERLFGTSASRKKTSEMAAIPSRVFVLNSY